MSSPSLAAPALARARDRLARRRTAGVLSRHHLLIIAIAIVIAIIALLLPRTGHAEHDTEHQDGLVDVAGLDRVEDLAQV
ncbi:hypothetical protein ACQCSJ_24570, partial [Ralstonia pseudosolanacearum]